MASEEFRAFQEAMAARPVPAPPTSLDEQRQRIDQAMGAIPLAEGTEALDVDADGVHTIECRVTGCAADAPVLLYFHGGGFRLASALAYRAYGSHMAKAIGGRVVLVDYRLAPEHRFPAAFDDCVTVYRWLLSNGVAPNRIVVSGDSAGGGLAASLAITAAGGGVAQPAAFVLCSPWVDLTVTAPTYDSNATNDRLFSRESASTAAGMYLADHAPTDPLASPLFGSWSGCAPVFIQVGDIEVLLDDARRLTETISAAGGDVTTHVYADMPHVWQLSYPAFPEAIEAVEELAAFVLRHTR